MNYISTNPKFAAFFEKINNQGGKATFKDLASHPIKSMRYLTLKKMEIEPAPSSKNTGGVLAMVNEQIKKSGLRADGTHIRYEISDDIMRKAYDFPDDRVIAKTLSSIFEFAEKQKIESLKIGIREYHGDSVTGPVVELDIEFFGNRNDHGFGERLHTLATVELFHWFHDNWLHKNEKGRVLDEGEFLGHNAFSTRAGIIESCASPDMLMLFLTSNYLSGQAKQDNRGITRGLAEILTADAMH